MSYAEYNMQMQQKLQSLQKDIVKETCKMFLIKIFIMSFLMTLLRGLAKNAQE